MRSRDVNGGLLLGRYSYVVVSKGPVRVEGEAVREVEDEEEEGEKEAEEGFGTVANEGDGEMDEAAPPLSSPPPPPPSATRRLPLPPVFYSHRYHRVLSPSSRAAST